MKPNNTCTNKTLFTIILSVAALVFLALAIALIVREQAHREAEICVYGFIASMVILLFYKGWCVLRKL